MDMNLREMNKIQEGERMVKNKRGRKGTPIPGYEDRNVDTWAMFDGEWVYQRKTGKRIAGVVDDGEYSYYSINGLKMRQEM
jgi:hypothetical protein